ncbi:MAG: hypothetical protein ABSD73_12275 [Candidatus Bathyarchaeia archaeon]
MEQVKHLNRVEIRQTTDETDYATSESAFAFLRTVAARDALPIFEFLRQLSNRKVDSVSLSREAPYRYLFASVSGSTVTVIFKEEKKTVEMCFPFHTMKNLFVQTIA